MHHDDDTVEFTPLEALQAKFFGPRPRPVKVTFGALSHPGKVRPNNEDHYLVVRRRRLREIVTTNLPQGFLPPTDEDAYAMVVADGMGGAAFGDLASMLALRTGWDLGLQEIKWTLKINEDEIRELLEKLQLFFQLIDRALVDRAENEPQLTGMGTTLTGAYTVGPEAFLVHVGDSRAYLHRDGSLRRLTRDHTMAEQLADSGLIDSTSPELRHMRHVLTNCLGGPHRGVAVDVQHLRLADNDRLLLCTDGLTDLVEDEEIAQALERDPDPSCVCQALVDQALDCGGRDNVTVVVADYEVLAGSEESTSSGSFRHGA